MLGLYDSGPQVSVGHSGESGEKEKHIGDSQVLNHILGGE